MTLIEELQSNKRLQVGLWLIAGIVLIYGALEWWDRIERDQKRLLALQTELATVKSRATVKPELARERLAQFTAYEKVLANKLWVNSSEAAAQARLRDWLNEIARSTKSSRYLITLGAVTPASVGADASEFQGLKQLKANLSFDFQPQVLEDALLAIEGGKQFAFVESLSVNKRARRVEINVTVYGRVDANAPSAASEAPSNPQLFPSGGKS